MSVLPHISFIIRLNAKLTPETLNVPRHHELVVWRQDKHNRFILEAFQVTLFNSQ